MRGELRISDALETHQRDLLSDKPIVVFCDCPEHHAASTVMRAFKKASLAKARPLLNGLKGGIESGFDIVGVEPASSTATAA